MFDGWSLRDRVLSAPPGPRKPAHPPGYARGAPAGRPARHLSGPEADASAVDLLAGNAHTFGAGPARRPRTYDGTAIGARCAPRTRGRGISRLRSVQSPPQSSLVPLVSGWHRDRGRSPPFSPARPAVGRAPCPNDVHLG